MSRGYVWDQNGEKAKRFTISRRETYILRQEVGKLGVENVVRL